MRTLLQSLALLAGAGLATLAQAEQIKVMTSGGFTAAYQALGPRFAQASGNTLETTLGPSMGQAPRGHPQPPGARRACRRGDHGGVCAR